MKAVIPFLNIQLPFKDASIQKAFVAKAETQSSTNEGFRCCGNIVSVLWTDGGMENLRGGLKMLFYSFLCWNWLDPLAASNQLLEEANISEETKG